MEHSSLDMEAVTDVVIKLQLSCDINKMWVVPKGEDFTS